MLDEDSFVRLDALAKHRGTNFNLGEKRPLGDGVVTGYGAIDGRDGHLQPGRHGVWQPWRGVRRENRQVQERRQDRPSASSASTTVLARIRKVSSRWACTAVSFATSWPRRHPANLVDHRAAAGEHVSPLTDFVIMVDQTSGNITGPVIKTVTGEEVTMEKFGGAHTHMAKSGCGTLRRIGRTRTPDYVRELLSYLPPNNSTDAPRYQAAAPTGYRGRTCEDLELDAADPGLAQPAYDMHEVITRLLDDEFLEIQAGYAQNIVVGFRAHIDGRPVGIVANQPTPRRLPGYQRLGKRPGLRGPATASISPSSCWWTSRASLPEGAIKIQCIIRRGANCSTPGGPPYQRSGHHPQGLRRCVLRYGLKDGLTSTWRGRPRESR